MPRRVRSAAAGQAEDLCDLSGSDYVYTWADSDGYRESADSWADVLRDCRRRGMRAPVLAVGDGAARMHRNAPKTLTR